MPDEPNTTERGRFTIGSPVWFRDGAGEHHTARLPGTVVADYRDEATANDHLGRDWVLALARRRSNVWWAMLRDSTVYQPRPPIAAAA